MKKISILLAILLVFTGCSSDNKKVTMEKAEGANYSTVEYYAKKDLVYKQIIKNHVVVDKKIYTEDYIKENLEQSKKEINDIKGMKYDYNIDKEGNVTEIIEVDFENLDTEAYQKINQENIQGDISQGVSLKASIELSKQQGFEEVK